jgi:sugar phosphate isomerase/epimerase
MSKTSNRRTSLKAGADTGADESLAKSAPAAEKNKPEHKTLLGFDNYSIHLLKWNASQLIDYAASLRLDSLFLTDLDVYENFSDGYLRDLKKKAADNGLVIHAGSWSICPTSKFFNKKWGTAEEHLALGLRVAKTLGSPVLRCILGMGEDRTTPGGIEARMADTIKVCRSARSQALDAGIKIAIENHAGDMQAWEVAGLCEEAGKDYVGVTLDTGNAAWTMEDPVESLEILAPYVAAVAMRDSMIWQTPQGAAMQWTAVGDGVVDFKTFVKRFVELCPGIPLNVESISGLTFDLPFFQKEFWNVWPKMRARDFAKFERLARLGKVRPPRQPADPKAEQAYQKCELERSLAYCKQTLGLGSKRG